LATYLYLYKYKSIYVVTPFHDLVSRWT